MRKCITHLTFALGIAFWVMPVTFAQAPVCDSPKLTATMLNIVRNARYVPISSMRILFDSLSAECPNYDEVSRQALASLGYSDFHALSDQLTAIGSHYQAIEASTSGEDLFPGTRLPFSSSLSVVSPLMDARVRLNRLAKIPARTALERLTTTALSQSVPAIIKPNASASQIIALSPTTSVDSFANYFSDSAIAALRNLDTTDRAEVIASIQVFVADPAFVPPSAAIATDASQAVSQIQALVKTTHAVDDQIAKVGTKLNTSVQSIQTEMASLSQLADNLANQTVSPDPKQIKLANAAATALVIISSTSSADLSNLLGQKTDQYISTLISDSDLKPVYSSLQSIVTSTTSITDGLSDANAEAASVLTVATALGVNKNITDAASTAMKDISSAVNIATSLASGNVFGVISGLGGLMGLGGPDETQLLQQHLDERLDKIEAEIGGLDRKLDDVLKTQSTIITELASIEQKVDEVLSQLSATKTAIMTELYKVDYHVLYSRIITADITEQQLNVCNAFLGNELQSGMSDQDTYAKKAEFFDANPNKLGSCADNLDNLITYGNISSAAATPNVFQLASTSDPSDLASTQKYLDEVATPILQFAKQRFTHCEINSFAHPVYNVIAFKPGVTYPICWGRDTGRQPSPANPFSPAEPTPDPTNPKTKLANDGWIADHLDTLLNYKAALGFGETVRGITPYLALTDRAQGNKHLVLELSLDSSFGQINLDSSVGMLRGALRYINASIAQQSVLENNQRLGDPYYDALRSAYMAGRSSCGSYCGNKDFKAAQPLYGDELLLVNELIYQMNYLGPVTQKPLVITASNGGQITPQQITDDIVELADMEQDFSNPAIWYLKFGQPVDIPSTASFATTSIGGKRVSQVVQFGLNPPHWNCADANEPNLKFQFMPYKVYAVQNGGFVATGKACDYPSPISSAPPDPDFSTVHLLPLNANLFGDFQTSIASAEMSALLDERDRIAWMLTEYSAMTELSDNELQTLAAINLISMSGQH